MSEGPKIKDDNVKLEAQGKHQGKGKGKYQGKGKRQGKGKGKGKGKTINYYLSKVHPPSHVLVSKLTLTSNMVNTVLTV